jgi:ABC-2 type transport system permease protein
MNRQDWRIVAAQTRMELALTARRGENILVTVIIPVILLVFFNSTGLIPSNGGSPLDYLVPGVLSIAIVSTGMVNLGIATAYERYYGVLKRLGGSPLPRWGLLAAKAIAVLALEVFQVILVVGVAVLGYGWSPHPSFGPLIVAMLLGTVAFSALGLAMAGALRAEATLAIANGLYLFFLLVGNVVLPSDHLPAFLRPVGAVLPVTALSDTLRFGWGSTGANPTSSYVLLTGWAVVASFLAIRSFRWE